MDTGGFINVPDQTECVDKYTASIDLSNACRQFYKSRVEAADCIKSRWEKQAAHTTRCSTHVNDNDRPTDDTCSSRGSSSSSSKSTQRRQRSSIDEAMDKLRTEMTSLMDQDLSLMKQLLTLNETIEELKWQRRYYYSPQSSADLHHSDCSVSDTEMYESEDDLYTTTTATATTTTNNTTTSYCHRKHSVGHVTVTAASSEKRSQCVAEAERLVSESQSSVKGYHGEQDSFDSGIHETSSGEEEASV